MKRKQPAKRAVAGLMLAALLTVQTAAGTLVLADEASTETEETAPTNIATDYYGDQIAELTELSDAEKTDAKAIYDVLSSSLTPDNLEIAVALPNGFSIETDTKELTDEQKQQIETYVKRIGQTAVDAYAYDNPQTFWIDLGTTKYSYGYVSISNGDTYSANVTNVTVKVGVLTAYAASIAEDIEKLEEAVAAVQADETSRYTILKSIHDMLIEDNVYEEAAYAHEAYGGLVDGHSVCEGYAKAFKVLCDKYEIPCVLVSGVASDGLGKTESHMWNYVQMEDGKWYGVDVTWDDQGEKGTFHDFFLAGTDTVETNFGGDTFSELHQPDGDFNAAQIVKFVYPTLSETTYAGKVADDPDASKEPLTSEKPHASEEPDASKEPAGAVTYGDVDTNGEVNASDALMILKYVVKLTAFTDEQVKAADVDASGAVNATDALVVLKYVVRLIQAFPAAQG